jgi:HSP20 family protein
MRTVARWNPFRELAPFASFADLEPFFGEFPMRPFMGGYEPVPMMRMDVVEGEAGYTVKAEIPGLKKEDIAVSIDGCNVSVTAEVKRESEEKEGEKVLRSERYYGSLARTLTLPYEVDAAKAEATYEGGVLTLTLPKAPGVEAKRLAVH